MEMMYPLEWRIAISASLMRVDQRIELQIWAHSSLIKSALSTSPQLPQDAANRRRTLHRRGQSEEAHPAIVCTCSFASPGRTHATDKSKWGPKEADLPVQASTERAICFSKVLHVQLLDNVLHKLQYKDGKMVMAPECGKTLHNWVGGQLNLAGLNRVSQRAHIYFHAEWSASTAPQTLKNLQNPKKCGFGTVRAITLVRRPRKGSRAQDLCDMDIGLTKDSHRFQRELKSL